MQNLHAIKVKYLAPTDHKGSGFKMTSDRFEQSVTESYNYQYNNVVDMAVDWLESNGFEVVGTSEAKNGFIVLTSTFKGLRNE